jgi:putative membrane protein
MSPTRWLSVPDVPQARAVRASRRALVTSAAAVGLVVLLTGLAPYDRRTWWLDVSPVLFSVPILLVAWRRCPLTPLLYWLVAAALMMLAVGGHYTFERVPLGLWLQDAFELQRNPYDRLGHLVQGLMLAVAAREVLVRTSPLAGSGWLAPTSVAFALAVSAIYELIEWQAALWSPDGAVAFLGMQGDPWDAQWDMFMALAGATVAATLLARAHDRALARLDLSAPGVLPGVAAAVQRRAASAQGASVANRTLSSASSADA